jgi:hypothetical protein
MDSPAVRALSNGYIDGILSGHCKDEDVQICGTVSATHKTINIFAMPNGKRVGRSAFIKGILDAGRTGPNSHRVVFLVQILMR